jgi:hypothetical protein
MIQKRIQIQKVNGRLSYDLTDLCKTLPKHLMNDNLLVEFRAVLERILLQFNGSVNFYMFHGGTNFGFMAGANNIGTPPYILADITSYGNWILDLYISNTQGSHVAK